MLRCEPGVELKQLIENGPVFDGDTVHVDHVVILDDRCILELVPANQDTSAISARYDLQGNMLAPGFIDIQVNGGGGVLFNDTPTVESLRIIGEAHRQFGTTSFLPTLISDDIEVMARAAHAVDEAIQQGVPGVLGIHFEGPILSREYKGVHDESKFRELDEAAFDAIISLQNGCTLLTIAPEQVTGNDIRRLVEESVIVFAGHSGATYEEVKEALNTGVSGFTHLFNAMSPFQSREPGMVGAALEDAGSYFGIIADGYHVHPASLKVAIAAKRKGFAMLVTDAMPSVGSRSKSFELKGETIEAVDGRCLTPDGVLAGTDLDMMSAVRNTSRFAGIDFEEAVRMASVYPAHALGMETSLGYIKPGFRANLIEIDKMQTVTRSWSGGQMSGNNG